IPIENALGSRIIQPVRRKMGPMVLPLFHLPCNRVIGEKDYGTIVFKAFQYLLFYFQITGFVQIIIIEERNPFPSGQSDPGIPCAVGSLVAYVLGIAHTVVC